ncbi:MAG: hypothetical protein H6651_05045 [Ardenticatenales bacterium]|nr:hypothetical protein [Ardenticatenales bacterium]
MLSPVLALPSSAPSCGPVSLYISGYQIGFLAIAIGMLVGYAIASLGRGIDKIHGWMGGGFSLLGVIAGNLFTVAVHHPG